MPQTASMCSHVPPALSPGHCRVVQSILLAARSRLLYAPPSWDDLLAQAHATERRAYSVHSVNRWLPVQTHADTSRCARSRGPGFPTHGYILGKLAGTSSSSHLRLPTSIFIHERAYIRPYLYCAN